MDFWKRCGKSSFKHQETKSIATPKGVVELSSGWTFSRHNMGGRHYHLMLTGSENSGELTYFPGMPGDEINIWDSSPPVSEDPENNIPYSGFFGAVLDLPKTGLTGEAPVVLESIKDIILDGGESRISLGSLDSSGFLGAYDPRDRKSLISRLVAGIQ